MTEMSTKVEVACGHCDWIDKPDADFLAGCSAAGVLPFIDGAVVMVRNTRRAWEYPAGKMESGESPEECARREAREEAGLELVEMQMLGGYRHSYPDGRVLTGVWFTSAAERGGGPQDVKEISSVECFEQLPEELSYDDDLTRLLHREARKRVHRIPRWAKGSSPVERGVASTQQVLQREQLHTVCRSAACPNRGECYAHGTATFLIMGDQCTRNCRFCAVQSGQPGPLDPDEPYRLARAARELGLKYVVITSVTRDDLPDGGAGHFAECIRALRKEIPAVAIEVLTSDFRGDHSALKRVIEAGPDVFNHNVETVPRLYRRVRPRADYRRSLNILQWAHEMSGHRAVKSGLMVGLGETPSEVLEVLKDIRNAGCDLVTIGQYLRPSHAHLPVSEYVSPGRFEFYRREGEKAGFAGVSSGPLVRSSYNAAEAARAIEGRAKE